MAAQNMPPSSPANKTSTTYTAGLSGVARKATPPAKMAPMMNCPSAPMFQMLARKHTARPSAIRISGVALSVSSEMA